MYGSQMHDTYTVFNIMSTQYKPSTRPLLALELRTIGLRANHGYRGESLLKTGSVMLLITSW